MKPRISVCIPVHNGQRYLGRAIDSVLVQTFPDYELLIVDDASTDRSLNVAQGFADPRIRIVHNDRNMGMVRNWNTCISLARGEFISILHQDDFYLPDYLQREHELMSRDSRMGYVYSACWIVDSSGRALRLLRPFTSDHVWSGFEEFKRHILEDYSQFPTIMVRRKCFSRIGKFDEQLVLGPDWDMWLRIELAGYRIGYIATALACYRLHESSVSAAIYRKPMWALRENYNVIMKTFRNPVFPEKMGVREAAALRNNALVSLASALRLSTIVRGIGLRESLRLAFVARRLGLGFMNLVFYFLANRMKIVAKIIRHAFSR